MTDTDTMTCAKHPKVQTLLRCASCNIPICPKCSVQTAVGLKCKDCGTYRNADIFSLSPTRALAVIGIGLPAGALGALIAWVGFFAVWIAIPIPAQSAAMARHAMQQEYWLTLAFNPLGIIVIIIIAACAISRLRFNWNYFGW